MNTFTEHTIDAQGGPRRVLRYLVFAADDKPKDISLGGFQYDHDDLEYVLSQLREEALTTEYIRFEVLDTETFQTRVIEVQYVKAETYRVVLKSVPKDCQKTVIAYLGSVLKVVARDLPLYVQTCPSFVGQRLPQADAERMRDDLNALGAVAYSEVE
jgi:hypothetical protein